MSQMSRARLSLMMFIVLFNMVFALVASASTDAIKRLPVQDGGRVKPYDTFARETLQLVYGKQSYKDRPAIEIVTTWMLIPQHWDQEPIVVLDHRGVKEALGVEPTQKHFSPSELFQNQKLSMVFQELAVKRETKEKLDPYYQAVQRLENQLSMYHAVKLGQAIKPMPPKEGDSWKSVMQLEGAMREKFAVITKAFIRALPDKGEGKAADIPMDEGALEEAIVDFMASARAENPVVYGVDREIDVEIHFNSLHPFMWTWILYLLATILMLIAWETGSKKFAFMGWSSVALGFLLHCYGFGLRIYLTGRPPVSNMYESVVWVGFGAVLFAMIFEIQQRKNFILLVGSLVGTLCLIVADMAPIILDRSLQPLEPVLRSNLWLTVHVLTIAISYAAFFLAYGLSHLGFVALLRGADIGSERVRDIGQSVYRSIQIGVVLLAAGTILGGVWADYSWGRFWGWDPKETWALIALLGYLAILHARLTGWIKIFGLFVSTSIAFALVIMAWYGVNYILGAGLHSYGFGAGGVQYVAAVVAIDFLYIAYVCMHFKNQLRARKAT